MNNGGQKNGKKINVFGIGNSSGRLIELGLGG
jgi:hypothetical protein